MRFGSNKRIIIKVGTNTLTSVDGLLDKDYLQNLCNQISRLAQTGWEVALVSSGAVRAGMARLGLDSIRSLRESQAAAAVGQNLMMHLYETLFHEHGITVAQILLIADDFRNRKRYLNARNTLFTLFEKKVVPIINENDTISAEEIKFGDNDNLAAQVAGLVNAGVLIFLSDIDGLHERKAGKLGERLSEVFTITPEIELLAGGTGSKFGRGGMISKILGARIATESGTHVYIANGRENEVIARILADEKIGTHFYPQTTWRESRKRWIGMSGAVGGTLVVDDGASNALRSHGKSLLAAGILLSGGDFNAGDVVRIVNQQGEEIGRGLTNYNSAEINKIKGIHSRLIPQVLGYRGDPEVIHRDNMFTFKGIKEESNGVA